MDSNEFREFGRAAIDFVADYFDNIRERYEFYIQIKHFDFHCVY